MKIPTDAPVLVTGATGYVASWVVKDLLEAGATVHAAVRDPTNAEKIGHLKEMGEKAPGTIKFFKSDLLEEGSYEEGMKDCTVVFHTASPFTVDVKDPQKELIDPAVKGTRNVLETACKVPSVKRVVVTSSCAAIYTDAIDCEKAPNGTLTEDVWNTTASLAYQPYCYSKLLAEKEAWKIAEGQSQWDLVTVNPCLVLGPSLTSKTASESIKVVVQMGDGTMKSGVPKFGTGIVDVRDLSTAHIAAAFTEAAKGRYIIAGHCTDFLAAAATLLDKYGKDYPIPRSSPPKWLVWLLAPYLMKPVLPRKFISNNVNVPWKADNSKGKRDLGLTYRPLQETMQDMFQQLVDTGAIPKKN